MINKRQSRGDFKAFKARLKDKKGSAVDIILIVAFLFIFAISAFIMRYTSHTITGLLANNTAWNSSFNQTNLNITGVMVQSTEQAGLALDKVIMGVFIGLFIGLIVSSWLVGGHPIFMVLYIIMIILGTTFATILSDVYYDVVFNTYTNFGSTQLDFPLTTHIMHYLPIYIVIFSILGMIVMFGKPGIQQIR